MATTAPASTYVLVIGIMATVSSFGIVAIFTPPWYWYLIPVILALPEIVIVVRRVQRRRAMRRELQATLEELG